MTRAVDNRVITPERAEIPLMINGDMRHAQRGTSQTGQTSNHFPVDRFGFQMDTFGTWTSSQSTEVPTGQGFAKSLKLDCTTADASLGAGHFGFISHRFEGQNLQLLKKGTSNAEKVTISFWVKSNKTGNYVMELFDVDNTRQISQLYSISSADTWEQKVMTFAADTTGALGDDNEHSFAIHWVLGAGSTYSSGTLNTSWAANNNANRWVGGPNLADSTDNEWYLTGVQLEVGDFNAETMPEFQHESFADSLMRCERYCKAIIKEANYGPVMMAHGVDANVFRGAYFFQTPMRSAPSFTATGDFIRSYGTPTAASSATAVSTKYSHSIDWTASGVTALNQGILVTFKTGDASLIYSAEL